MPHRDAKLDETHQPQAQQSSAPRTCCASATKRRLGTTPWPSLLVVQGDVLQTLVAANLLQPKGKEVSHEAGFRLRRRRGFGSRGRTGRAPSQAYGGTDGASRFLLPLLSCYLL